MASTFVRCISNARGLIFSSIEFSSGPCFSQPLRHGHWFTKYYSYKKLTRPVSNEVLEKYKERAAVKLPDVKSAPSLLRKYLDDSIPESVKKIHSFEFMELDAAVDEVMKDKMQELGLSSTEDSTSHEIVRLTVRIRVQREQMNRRKNTRSLERSLLEMLDRRRYLLKLLRSEDYAKFLSIVEGLELSYEHEPRPGQDRPPLPGFQARLAETGNRCQALKLRRLAELSARSDAAKADFLRRREATLADARGKLATLGLSLEQVLDEVYADRRAVGERELLEDQLYWYYGEQRARVKHAAKLEEKAKAAQARGGRK